MSRDSGVRVRRARQARRAERAGRRASSSLEDARRPALSCRRTPTDAPAGFVVAPQAPPASHPVESRVPRDRGRAGARPSRYCAGIVDSGGTRSCASAIREGHAPSWPYASWFCNCLIRVGSFVPDDADFASDSDCRRLPAISLCHCNSLASNLGGATIGNRTRSCARDVCQSI